MKALNNNDRERLFGRFKFKADPTPSNPENIKILDNWEKNNIVLVPRGIPPIASAPFGRDVQIHRLVEPRFRALITAWQQAGLLKYILTFNGAYVPRFRRGSKNVLSAHSWGSAFDINAKWNPLGASPAPRDSEGTVLPLVPIARQLGWFWGGDFTGRKDAMHFEVVDLPQPS